jgi:hypothetical protein
MTATPGDLTIGWIAWGSARSNGGDLLGTDFSLRPAHRVSEPRMLTCCTSQREHRNGRHRGCPTTCAD